MPRRSPAQARLGYDFGVWRPVLAKLARASASLLGFIATHRGSVQARSLRALVLVRVAAPDAG